jgi:hypothetical protein
MIRRFDGLSVKSDWRAGNIASVREIDWMLAESPREDVAMSFNMSVGATP